MALCICKNHELGFSKTLMAKIEKAGLTTYLLGGSGISNTVAPLLSHSETILFLLSF